MKFKLNVWENYNKWAYSTPNVIYDVLQVSPLEGGSGSVIVVYEDGRTLILPNTVVVEIIKEEDPLVEVEQVIDEERE